MWLYPVSTLPLFARASIFHLTSGRCPSWLECSLKRSRLCFPYTTSIDSTKMESEPQYMPHEVLAAAIPVLIYSFVCLSLGVLLVTVLQKTRDGFNYVTLFALATTCTTIVSIIQQCNYIANWHDLRVQQYEQSITVKGNPALALGPLSKGFNAVLFWTILYFYNVDSVTMLFWAIALVFSVWNIRPRWLQRWQKHISWASKILAIVLPAIFSALRKGFQVNAGFIGTLILMNLLMLVSFAFGALCVILILFKYLRAKIGFDSYASASASKSYAGGSVVPGETATAREGRTVRRGLRARVDGWLVVRFSIAFLILSGFEIFLISFEINRYHKTKSTKLAGGPDFGIRASVVDVLNYLPGVTASLLAFLLFGTTAQQRAMYTPVIAALHPARWRRRPKSARFSGNVDQWRRMDHGDSRSSQQVAHGDIEMQLPTRKDKVTRTIVTTVEREEMIPSPPSANSVTRETVGNVGEGEIMGRRMIR
ncbi:hypothetical protein AUEXF2481DRAFT_206359 [Aureobasidium subglaciale EXF-2481]|uniref:Glycoside hydrolase n=1 Tax=Aureobasidium subglaciale (strain EXF-2481) TaxID=1043005 RepID=A0A074YQA2_AURSE|nr:uncharacterized protein AUEXF2481DRAFT_206359 [Aureobasidium subglaciale EXF-2481]KEQ99958.1 hypothetical protein AUEXF2481DRAFT_206359 [Aureobasidium subglaciale EXF-2481]